MGIGTKAYDAPQWFFMWSTGIPYLTSICSWTRRDCLREVERQMGEPWRKTYRKGGRVVKCSIYPKEE